MKTLATLFILFISTITVAQSTIQLSDYDILHNTEWKGTLTYKDYTSGKLQDVETLLQVEIKGDKIISDIQYTYEPKKNNRSKVKISEDGLFYGNEKVVSNTFENGVRTIKTTFQGKDNNIKATFYKTYTFSSTEFQIKKEVQYEDGEPFTRNIYNFKKQ